ncbi:bifunctional phosphoribosyl-AMP cyclohydrolase/phosphoribosyl-ATP diphosphatase HisIE [Thioalkalivibrio sp. HK1]|uniref:bifunctional phosphoribosyl-AMP cyclohydrolase/phosphoribosyl-ATP diphosphatase HisIE n=1 Tax=Thioalkalivibrio sp. HK1 TaxID=1469245 RepID=UPI00056EB591|nr:bifunctional phosphoribosyl-AMP cyclohydrolase/phosphoribosyl-ATP diphosphatase HisIE [Thioalkalivibrio sp. HK1]
MSAWLDEVRWNDQGLVPCIAYGRDDKRLWMLAWMNREALAATAREGRAVYWSRSKQRLWRKGEQSGFVQRVHEIRLDCDGDTVVLAVDQVGGIACHTGREHCFFRRLEGDRWVDVEPVRIPAEEIYREGEDGRVPADEEKAAPILPLAPSGDVLTDLARIIDARKGAPPDESYVASLHAKGVDAVLKKVGEEAAETIIAGKGSDRAALVHEVADLWFHSMVLLSSHGLSPTDVFDELSRRFGRSGLEEKAAR